MKNKQRLAKLLRAESLLKQTTRGYTPNGVYWRRGMPLLWEVRQDLGRSADGRKLANAHGLLKDTDNGYNPHAWRWKRAMALIDEVEEHLRPEPVPALGAFLEGGKSILLHQLTHMTSGIPVSRGIYPAFDEGFGDTGRAMLAVEAMRITRQSSAAGADAFYARGESGILYWYGHLVRAPATGKHFRKGEKISTIARIAASQGGPHGHLGVDARALTGGQTLKWGRNGNGPPYTFGAPPIGEQLRKAMSL